MMVHGSTFSGEGGFDLAAEWMGWTNLFNGDINPFCRAILQNRYPNATTHGNIKKTNFLPYRGLVDVLTGGFPCQPYSVSGQRKGKSDPRHLWPQMLRAAKEIQSTWIVGENVRGIVSWNGGLVFNEVQADLETAGYQVLPFLLPACAVNAPHRRDRIWFIAYSHSNDARRREYRKTGTAQGKSKSDQQEWQRIRTNAKRIGNEGNATNAGSKQFQERSQNSIGQNTKENAAGPNDRIERFGIAGHVTDPSNEGLQRHEFGKSFTNGNGSQALRSVAESLKIQSWDTWPVESPICSGNDGFFTESLRQRLRADSNGVISEEEIDKIFSKAYASWRRETIQAGGNAIVPQVAFQIYQAIELYQLNFL